MTNDEIRALALSHGFTLRPQPDGSMDLNPYVYAFARALIKKEREACAQLCEEGWKRGLGEKYQGDVFAAAVRARGES